MKWNGKVRTENDGTFLSHCSMSIVQRNSSWKSVQNDTIFSPHSSLIQKHFLPFSPRNILNKSEKSEEADRRKRERVGERERQEESSVTAGINEVCEWNSHELLMSNTIQKHDMFNLLSSLSYTFTPLYGIGIVSLLTRSVERMRKERERERTKARAMGKGGEREVVQKSLTWTDFLFFLTHLNHILWTSMFYEKKERGWGGEGW